MSTAPEISPEQDPPDRHRLNTPTAETDRPPVEAPLRQEDNSEEDPGAASTEGDRRRAAQDEVLVEMLAAGASYKLASEAVGVTARTVTRRMVDDHFANRVSRRRGETVAELTGQLTSMGADALDVLRDCLKAERPADKLRAAQLLLTLMARFRHETELEDRIAAIEVRLEASPDGDKGATR